MINPMPKPLAIDLFAGSFGWGRAFAAEGWHVIGFDIEHQAYHGPVPDGCELVLQDVLTLHGSQFRDAAVIVASPPCQRYSYMAMPWSRAKREVRWQRWQRTSPFSPGFDLNALFDACFRIQREASEAAGHRIPLVVENVKGAQPWVGPARAHFGSYYLWGDVDSVGGRIVAGGLRFGQTLTARRRTKNNGGSWFNVAHNTESGTGRNPVNGDGVKCGGSVGDDWFTHHNRDEFLERAGVKGPGGDWFANGRQGQDACAEGIKQRGSGPEWFDNGIAHLPSSSPGRRAASAQIAQIPLDLARYIARSFHPAADLADHIR